MSTLKTNFLQHPSSSSVNLTLGSDGSVTGALPSPNRNLLHNGALRIAQRGTSTTGITTDGYYTADRWLFSGYAGRGTWTQSIATDAPSGSGFTSSLKMLCTTNVASPSTSAFTVIRQNIEGQDVQQILYGTASAKQVTLSFWVKSNVTGTFVVYLGQPSNSRFFGQSYTVTASGTWEKKTLTFSGDTVNGPANDNSGGFAVNFVLMAGSDYGTAALPSAWVSGAGNAMTGQVNVAAAVNNYWQITGVQLEAGTAATPFEFKPYAQELLACQRYFERFTNVDSAALAQTDVANRPEVLLTYYLKRAAPTVTVGNPTSFIVYFYNRSGTASVTSYGGTLVGTAPTYANLFFNTASGVNAYDLVALTNSGGTGYIDVSAEL